MFVYVQKFFNKNLYFSSDFHGRHDRDFIYRPRGFNSSDEHELSGRKQYRELPKDSTLFLLGDTVFGNDGVVYWEDLIKDIGSSHLYVMPGNHYSGLNDIYRKYGRSFTLDGYDGNHKNVNLIPNIYEIEVCGQFVVLSHYPILSWNKVGKGSWMIHGHTHGRIEGTKPNETKLGKILDVGFESVKGPISYNEIELIMSKKPLYSPDYH